MMKTKIQLNKKHVLFFFFLSFIGILQMNAQDKSTEDILKSFVESYQTDHMAHTITFGIRVGDNWWYVKSKRKQDSYKVGKKKQYTFHNFSPNEVSLHKGKPIVPTWYFHFANKEVLDNIDKKKLNPEDLGKVQVKGREEPVQIYKVS